MAKVKAFALTHRGIDDVAAEEIERIAGSKAITAAPGILVFECDYRKLCLLCYRAQSLVKVAAFLSEFEAAQRLDASLESAGKSLEGADLAMWLHEQSFKVSCMRFGEHDYSSHDFAMALGKAVKEKVENKLDLKKPACFLFAAISGRKGFFGVDLAGIDLSKRDYKVFATSSSLRGTIAYALVWLAGFSGRGSLLDPFCKCGVIPIEAAALSANYPINFFRKESLAFRSIRFSGVDSDELLAAADLDIMKSQAAVFCTDPDMRHVAAAKKNAKIAGLNKSISFSRMDMEWLDTKFDEKQIDAVVSYLSFRKGVDAAKVCRETFYQAGYILSDAGRIALISNKPEILVAAARAYKFVISHSRKLWSGKQEMEAMVFSRQ